LKKLNRKKKPIKLIKILKKPTGSVRFWFYKHETEKTKPNSNRKNQTEPEKTEPNRFEPVFVLKNRTEICRFEPVLVFKKIQFDYFFYKNRTEQKIITPANYYIYHLEFIFLILTFAMFLMTLKIT
jgi:hypothetical protein